MEKLKRNLLFLPTLVLLFSACSPWQKVRVENPKLEKLQWSSENEDGKGARELELRILATVKNPNNSSFKVVSSDLDFFLDGQEVGDAELQEKVKIPADSEEEHSFHVKAELKDVAAGGLKALGSVLGGTAPELRIKGTIKGRAYGILTKEFPVDESRKINISDLMGQRIGSRSSITLNPNKPSAVR